LAKERRSFPRLEQRRADKGSVEKHGKLARELIGRWDLQTLSNALQPSTHFTLVRLRNLAGRVVGLGELCSDVDLRAAAVA
jgi:hypothetical protein